VRNADYKGAIDDLAIFSRALTQEEVQAVMLGLGSRGIAMSPYPEDVASDVPYDATLSWTAGEFAATHDVYFGTAFEDVNSASRANPLNAPVSQG